MCEKGVYIADAALVTKENLELLAQENVHFISRLPGTYKLSEQLKQAAWEKEEKWQEIDLAEGRDGVSYKIQSFRRLYGRTYRFVVVRSSSMDARKEHKLESVLERERTELQKAAKRLGKNVYRCEQDAQVAAERSSTNIVVQSIACKRVYVPNRCKRRGLAAAGRVKTSLHHWCGYSTV